jgi:hypothetical protein
MLRGELRAHIPQMCYERYYAHVPKEDQMIKLDPWNVIVAVTISDNPSMFFRVSPVRAAGVPSVRDFYCEK